MTTHLSLGERLRAERQRLGLRQSDLAEMAGISQATLSRIESAGQLPTYGTLAALRKAGVDMARLMGPARPRRT